MTLNFRQFVYVSILTLIVLFGVKQCSEQVLTPYFSRETLTESRLQYQKSQENFVKHNIESVLQKLLGKGTFDVSVVMSFKEEYVQQNVIKRDPQKASETTSEETSKEFQRLRAEALDDRSSVDTVRKVANAQRSKLPGLIDLGSQNSIKDALPGFPVLPSSMETKSDVMADKPSLAEISEKPVSDPDMNPEGKDTDSYKRKIEQSRVYYNETYTNTTRPQNRIEHMVVNVVVDSDQMKLLELSKDQLEGLISDVASINPSRGDELNITFLPFIEKSFGIQQFYAKNRKLLTFIGGVFDRLRFVIFGLIALLIFGGLGYWMYSSFRKKMAERQKQMEEERARRLEEDKLKEKEKMDIAEEKRKAVVSLAQSKPNDIATLILNWIEAFEGEEGKKNVPGA